MAKVSFVRGTDAQIEELEVTEGQVIVSESGSMYVDTDSERIEIAPDEETITAVYDTTVATMVHSVDDYVYVNDYLYRVTSAIAIGDTIAVGTNVVLATDIEADTPIYITGLPESSGGMQADDVGYDNTDSGLTATNVQGAIDELKSSIPLSSGGGGSSKYNTNCKAKIGLSIDKDTTMFGYAVPKTWNGYDDFAGDYIWTDGENIYYSYYSDQYILDKATETWGDKEWYDEYEDEVENLLAGCIWSDGNNIYYSRGDTQYILNKSTGIWEDKEWSGLTSFYGGNIWTDGVNIYYSDGSSNYVLNESTNTWSSKSWSGLTEFYGYRVWTNGEFIYYSDGTDHYRLYGRGTSAWSSTSWSGLTDFDGASIWTDGYGIYYSSFGDQYALKKTDGSNVWSAVTWTGIGDFNAESIWSDGEHIYYSDGTNHYELHTFVPSTKF